MRITGGLTVLAVLAVLLVGCAGVQRSAPAFQTVDMNQDLDATTLSRYEQAARSASKEDSGHTALLEKTNWWPLGLIAYWKQGTVRAMPDGTGKHEYVVSECKGFGPLSVLFVSKTQTVYDGNGQRKSQMAASSVMWGHLAMFHTMGSEAHHGHWMEHKSAHVFHHLFNFGDDHGGSFFSFASAPNPIGMGQ